jgi:hypothetical protein
MDKLQIIIKGDNVYHEIEVDKLEIKRNVNSNHIVMLMENNLDYKIEDVGATILLNAIAIPLVKNEKDIK